MQIVLDPEFFPITVLFTFGFVFLTTVGMHYYSRGSRLKWWARAWTVYFFGFIPILYRTPNALNSMDLFFFGISLIGGSTLMRGFEWTTKKRPSLMEGYGIVTAIAAIVWTLFLLLPIPSDFIYVLSGGVTCVVAVLALHSLLRDERERTPLTMMSVASFAIWSAAGIFAITMLWFDTFWMFIYMHAFSWLCLGVTAFLMLVQNTNQKLEFELMITRTVGGLINHDLRNYVNNATYALELIEPLSAKNEQWITMAGDALNSARRFMTTTKRALHLLSTSPSRKNSLHLDAVISGVISRVTQEHGLDVSCFDSTGIEDLQVMSNPLLHELLWNILDNAAKCGECQVTLESVESSDSSLTLQITDQSGGIRSELKEYLNTRVMKSESLPTGSGLGLVLIKELAPLCSVKFHVTDNIIDGEVAGTCYSLTFERGTQEYVE